MTKAVQPFLTKKRTADIKSAVLSPNTIGSLYILVFGYDKAHSEAEGALFLFKEPEPCRYFAGFTGSYRSNPQYFRKAILFYTIIISLSIAKQQIMYH